jgi:transcription elongation GreA/GreB family factor
MSICDHASLLPSSAGIHVNNIKTELIRLIIERLTTDLELFHNAAKTAHMASIDEQNQPDNKYDTLALEASYVAQGQANRAQEIRRSIDVYRHLEHLPDSEAIRLASLVTLVDESGIRKLIFIGPAEGGLRIATDQGDVMVITPASPLGKNLIGKTTGDMVEIRRGGTCIEYLIAGVA